jgi:dolichyl-phosphate-mannose-protein mannosyltransferase
MKSSKFMQTTQSEACIRWLTLSLSFGGFASKYIKGRFFMDVHPPLAKMLITLAGWLAGFDGNFDFKDIGKDYLEPGVPYVAMRLLPAVCGILTIPTMFLTLKATGCRTTTAALGAALVIFGMRQSKVAVRCVLTDCR